jgi:hypothetical protein
MSCRFIDKVRFTSSNRERYSIKTYWFYYQNYFKISLGELMNR